MHRHARRHSHLSTWHRQGAFTIIELLVVIIIITLLTSVATTSYLNAQRSARDSARKAKVNSIATAVESYYRVNQKFPGQNYVAPTAPSNAYLNATRGCELFDATTQTFVYTYFPTVAGSGSLPTQPCDVRGPVTDGAYRFVPDDFKPFPNWIPGLGAYLNPTPSESRYTGQNGVEGAEYDMAQDPLRAISNTQRTLTYNKLRNGYMVYILLENPGDKDAVQDIPKTFADEPKYPNGSSVVVNSENVYLIRK